MEILDAATARSDQAESGEYLDFCINQAARIVAPYWPLSSFVAGNALGGLEDQPFSQAMESARQLRGGSGYLAPVTYRAFFAKGRITLSDLEYAINTWLREQSWPETVTVGEKVISTGQLVSRWLLDPKNYAEAAKTKGKLEGVVSRKLQTLNLMDPLARESGPIIETLGEKSFTRDRQSVTSVINKRMIAWCAAFLDEGQAAWSMPGRESGFYTAWKALAGMDSAFRYYAGHNVTKKLDLLPERASEALKCLLQELEIPLADWPGYLARHLGLLPGWASFIKWREEHPEVPEHQRHPITLTQYLAVRLFYETVLIGQQSIIYKVQPRLKKPAQVANSRLSEQTASRDQENTVTVAVRLALAFDALEQTASAIEQLADENFQRLVQLACRLDPQTEQSIWQEAYEWHYRQRLMSDIHLAHLQAASAPASPGNTPAVQAVFCIDVRSEGLRRHLEKAGSYETFGFAGFFGVPMIYQPFGSSATLTIAPALLTPTRLIKEIPQNTTPDIIERRWWFNNLRYTWARLRRTLRENLLTPFAFVEMAGWLSFFPLVGKTVAPHAWRKLGTSLQERLSPAVPTAPSILTDSTEMSLAEQAGAVVGMLRSIGLTGRFARLVLLCGHGSQTANNPYASALDCGACGGNHGGPSALVAASILNSKAVRSILQAQGITIPEETFFLAGEHNTTTDVVRFLNQDYIPVTHRAEFTAFKAAICAAGKANAAERWQNLPGTSGKAAVKRRASDWAQVRPEWGLVRNAAFVCGRRELTRRLNLDNRVFLHSYDYRHDPDGTILEGILTAPVIVAEWINMQYYLSTVDNQAYGSSTKLLHTVVSEVGVMQGRQSDLLTGLPRQSVMVGEHLYHEPMRLCVIVESPRATISQIIAKHEKLQNLTTNSWLNLTAYDEVENSFFQYTSAGNWEEVRNLD